MLVGAGLSLLSALLLLLAFPTFEQWYFAWIAFVPLLWAIAVKPSVWRAFLLGELFGTVFFYGSCWWITYSMIHYGDLAPIVAYLVSLIPIMLSALLPAGFAAALAYLIKKRGVGALLTAPFFWVANEYLRLLLTGMSWNSLGYSQSFQPAMIWPASLGGVYLISAIILLCNAAIVYAVRARSTRALATAAAVLIMVVTIFFIGKSSSAVKPTSGLDVVAVQANAPVSTKNDEASDRALKASLNDQIRMSVEAVVQLRREGDNKRPILVVWPEAPYNFEYPQNESLREDFAGFVRRNNIYLMINAETTVSQQGVRYNSVVAIGPTGEMVGQYDKIHLLPFGEYIPLKNYLPFIDLIPAMVGDYTPASKYSVINIEGIPIGAFICFESVFPDITRELARAGATVFINVADDAWFGPTPITRQHLAHVAMRAAETHKPILRVTNSGISAYIAADGRVSEESPIFQTATRYWKIDNINTPPTLYVRIGDSFVISALIISILLLIANTTRVSAQLSRLFRME